MLIVILLHFFRGNGYETSMKEVRTSYQYVSPGHAGMKHSLYDHKPEEFGPSSTTIPFSNGGNDNHDFYVADTEKECETANNEQHKVYEDENSAINSEEQVTEEDAPKNGEDNETVTISV